MKVKLDDLVEHFEVINELHTCYLNRTTGQFHLIPEEVESYVYSEELVKDELPEWEKEFVPIYKDIVANPDEYIKLPDRFYINIYSVVERFILSLRDVNIRNKIYYEIKGKGSLGRFKDLTEKFGISDEWYRYKDQALRELAIVWCAENDLEYY